MTRTDRMQPRQLVSTKLLSFLYHWLTLDYCFLVSEKLNRCGIKTNILTTQTVRACRNAIEFNSIPSVARLVPNGYEGLKLDVLLAVPAKYRDGLDLSKVQEVFPYGSIRFQIQDGGMIAPSGIAIERLGDVNDDMVVVCCAVSVGY